MTDSVADFTCILAYALWVVSHEYLLNGKLLACEVGLEGRIRVHRGRAFPSVTQVSQCKPESQNLFATQVCPSLRAAAETAKREAVTKRVATEVNLSMDIDNEGRDGGMRRRQTRLTFRAWCEAFFGSSVVG